MVDIIILMNVFYKLKNTLTMMTYKDVKLILVKDYNLEKSKIDSERKAFNL